MNFRKYTQPNHVVHASTNGKIADIIYASHFKFLAERFLKKALENRFSTVGGTGIEYTYQKNKCF